MKINQEDDGNKLVVFSKTQRKQEDYRNELIVIDKTRNKSRRL